jgi:hypothetical protein
MRVKLYRFSQLSIIFETVHAPAFNLEPQAFVSLASFFWLKHEHHIVHEDLLRAVVVPSAWYCSV